jgi:hypothetical protein
MKNKYLTTEAPLDEPEIINYTGLSRRRDGKQADDVDIRPHLVQETFHLNQQSQEDEQCS